MSPRVFVSFVTAWALALSPTCLAAGRDASQVLSETVVLKSVLETYRDVRPAPAAAKLSEQDFLARRDQMVAALDRQVLMLETSALSDQELRQKAEKATRDSMSALRHELTRFIRSDLAADRADALAALASDYGKYADHLAAARDTRDALASCVASDVDYVSDQLSRQWAQYTKADFVRDLKTKRAAISSLRYDGGRYDEFFEMSWEVLTTRDGIEMMAFLITFWIDILLIPAVIIIKVWDYLSPKRVLRTTG